MACYEVVREIQNSCANNQMRDVFFEEVEIDSPEDYVRQVLKAETDLRLTVQMRDEDALTIFAESEGMAQRFIFTRI